MSQLDGTITAIKKAKPLRVRLFGVSIYQPDNAY